MAEQGKRSSGRNHQSTLSRRELLRSTMMGAASLAAAGIALPGSARANPSGLSPAAEQSAPAGMWTPLLNQPPFPASTMLLLTDGTVMCHESSGKNWWLLTPDTLGDYTRGTWSRLAPMRYTRLYYASAVLADGRVFVAGGEYSDAGSRTNKVEVYDPLADAWTEVAPPAGWSNIGDAPCSVLTDGRVLLGSIFDRRTAIYDPGADAWTAGANKDDSSATEESWTILPDQTILTVECRSRPKAEKYIQETGVWVSAGVVPTPLVQASSLEIGPFVLLPDGRCLCIGSTGHTALYTPASNAADPGSWEVGPDFPPYQPGQDLMEAKDAPACLLPNGKVLCTVSPAGEGGSFPSPTLFFEYDGGLNRAPDPPNRNHPAYTGRMMVLPTGQVLYADGSRAIYVYTPDGDPDPSWRPTITDCPSCVQAGQSYALSGTQINGLSEAVTYGDDASMSTNYPLVRILSLENGGVRYARTFGHSIMAVATGDSIQSTNFAVPPDITSGCAELRAVANGIASDAWRIRIAPAG